MSGDRARQVESSAGARTAAVLHDMAGNQVLGAALGGEALDGFGTAMAEEMTGALGGVEAAGSVGSNLAMARLLRHASEILDTAAADRDIRSSSGRRLDDEQRERFEQAFEHDFDHVEVHTDGAASRAAHALNAQAFALGADVFFGAGGFAPGTQRGDRLLAHELTHVVQHDQGRLPTASDDMEVSSPSDPHEVEAYANEQVMLRRLSEVDAALAAEDVDRAGETGLADSQTGTAEAGATASDSAEVDSAEVDSEEVDSTEVDSEEVDSTEVDSEEVDSAEVDAGVQLGDDGDDGVVDGPVEGAPAMLKRNAGGGRMTRERAPDVQDSPGRPLPRAVAQRMSAALGHDFAGVRVHTDASAGDASRELDARAFALGADLYFAPGAFQPGTEQGDELLAHELTHVQQHDEGRLAGLFGPDLHLEAAAEHEADQRADDASTVLADEGLLALAGLSDDGFAGDAAALHAAARDQREGATASLVHRIAARLGIPAATVDVRFDDEARARTEAVGDVGLMQGGVVWLHPEHYDPATRGGRSLLAHEVVHVAQDRLPSDPAAVGEHAEVEAAVLADDFASGATPAAPTMALPTGHVAREGGPSVQDIQSLRETFKSVTEQKKAAANQQKSSAGSDTKDKDLDKPKEQDRDELDDYEDGIDDAVDRLEDLEAFDDLIDAYNDDESTSGPMGRIKGSKAYEDIVEQWKGARENENYPSSMQSLFNEEFDRAWATNSQGYEDALFRVRREARNDGDAELAAEAALEELEKAKAAKEKAKKQVDDNAGGEPGQGTDKSKAGNQGPSPSEVSLDPVEQMPPEGPEYLRAESRHENLWPTVEGEFAHFESYNQGMQEEANDKTQRIGPVAEQMFGGMLTGFSGGFVDGMKDKFLTDVVGGGLDKLVAASPKFGGAMRGVPMFSSAMKLTQMGMSGTFSDIGNIASGDWEKSARGQKINQSLEGITAASNAWADGDALDRVGIVIMIIADVLQIVCEVLGFVVDLLNLIENICWVLGGLFIILGIAFSWCGFGFLLPWGLKLCDVARALQPITKWLEPIVDALSMAVAILRPIAALLVPAELYGMALANTAESGEYFGGKVADQAVDDIANNAKSEAEKPPEQPDTDVDNPVQDGQDTGDSDANADANAVAEFGDDQVNKIKDTESEVQDAIDQNEKKQQELEQADEEHRKKQEEGKDEDEGADKPKDDDQEAGDQKPSKTKQAGKAIWNTIKTGISKPFTELNTLGAKWRDIKTQSSALFSGSYENSKNAASDQVSEASQKRDEIIGQMFDADADAAKIHEQLAQTSDQLAEMKANDADPVQIDQVQKQLDELKKTHEQVSTVFDDLNKDVQKSQEYLQSVRDKERENVQNALYNDLQEEGNDLYSPNPIKSMKQAKQNKKPEQLEGELETIKSQKSEAEQQSKQLDKTIETVQDQAETQKEREKKQQALDELAEQKSESSDEASKLNQQADAIDKANAMLADADKKQNAATRASNEAKEAKAFLDDSKKKRVRVANADNASGESKLVLQEVRDDGLVLGKDDTFYSWEEIQGPRDIKEAGQTYQDKTTEAAELEQQASDLRTDGNELKEQSKGTGETEGATPDPQALRDQAAKASTKAGQIEQQLAETQEALDSLGNGKSSMTAQDYAEQLAFLRSKQSKQEQTLAELDKKQDQLEGDLQQAQQQATTADATEVMEQGTQQHDAATSERENKKEAKTGLGGGPLPESGLYKKYMDLFVNSKKTGLGKLGKTIVKMAKKPPKSEKAKQKEIEDAAKAMSPGKHSGKEPEAPSDDVVANAEEALKAGAKDPGFAEEAMSFALDTGGFVKEKLQSGMENMGLSRANADLIPQSAGGKAPDPPMDTQVLQEKWDLARQEQEEYTLYWVWAFKAYQAEQIAQDKAVEAEQLAVQVGNKVKEQAEANEAPLQEGRSNEEKRQQMLEENKPETKESDSGMGGFLQTIISALMEGGDEVDDAPDMNDADPSQTQDEAHDQTQKAHEESKEGSRKQKEHVDKMIDTNQQMKTSIADDQNRAQDKAQQDLATAGEIDSLKQDNLSQAAQHYAASEAAASEYNAGLDLMTVWAADWRQRREKANIGLNQDGSNDGWMSSLTGMEQSMADETVRVGKDK